MNTQTAQRLSNELNDIIGRLDTTVRWIMENGSAKEFQH